MPPNNQASEQAMGWESLIAPCGRHQHLETKPKVEEEVPKKRSDIDENKTINLGTYGASVTPLLVLLLGLCCGFYAYHDFPFDTRVEGWFLVNNTPGMIIISVIYILFSMTWGPRYMRDRKPLKLKEVMIAYNAFQVAFSLYMFIETGIVGWFFDYSFRCQPCDYSLDDKPVRMTRVAHWYFLSKILDFVDTILFVLRGKFSQITNLHVIHHSCMFMSMWFGIHHTPGGHITFMGFLNTFVHTVMYLYYLLAALGPRVRPYLWWKRYLTKLQLTQFVLIFLHAAQLLVFPCEGVPTELVLWTLLYAFIFFALFIDFYIKAYLNRLSAKKNEKARESLKANGHLNGYANGSVNGYKQDTNGNLPNGSVSHGSIANGSTSRLRNGTASREDSA